MTEREYILVSDLKTVRHAQQMLSDLHTGTVPDDEKAQVYALLVKWGEALHALVQIGHEPSGLDAWQVTPQEIIERFQEGERLVASAEELNEQFPGGQGPLDVLKRGGRR